MNSFAVDSRVAGTDHDIMSDENPGLRVHFSSDLPQTFGVYLVGGQPEVSPVPLPLPSALLHLPICLGSLFFPSRTPLTERSLELSRGRLAERPCPRRARRSRTRCCARSGRGAGGPGFWVGGSPGGGTHLWVPGRFPTARRAASPRSRSTGRSPPQSLPPPPVHHPSPLLLPQRHRCCPRD